MKRILSISLAALLAATFIGCSGTQKQADNAPPAKTGQATEAPVKEDPVTIKIFVPEPTDINSTGRDWVNQKSMRKIKEVALERFNLNLELEEAVPDTEQMMTILNTRFAAGSDIPDVINLQYPLIDAINLYNQGKILSVSAYPDSIPDILAAFDEVPSLKLGNCANDGSVIRIPSVMFNSQHVTQWGLIRKDWLDAAGLDIPTTTDEYRDALRAFSQKDMNGNGLKDECIYSSYTATAAVLGPAFGAYGLTDAANSWFAGADGKVYPVMLTGEAKAYVEYVASLYKEGLIWDLSYSPTAGAEWGNFISKNREAGEFGRFWFALVTNISYNGGDVAGGDADFIMINPLTDGIHKATIMKENYTGSGSVMLSSACKAPERVAAFYNWFYTREGTDIGYYGETWPGDEFYEDNGDGGLRLSALGETTQAENGGSLGGVTGANNGLWPLKSVVSDKDVAFDKSLSLDTSLTRSASNPERAYEMLQGYQKNHVDNLAMVVPNGDQSAVLSGAADLFAYMDEMYQKFITGVKPLSNWDAFAAQCEAQGIGKVTEVQQARYDAYKAMR